MYKQNKLIIINKYPNLFHKYKLNIRNPNNKIKYTIIQNCSIHKKYICHIHCYKLTLLDEMFSIYIDIIQKYFDIIVTYNILDDSIINKYSNITFITHDNYGLDIGPKFIVNHYINTKNIKFNYIFFIHSKTNLEARNNYILPFINNLDKIIDILNNNNIGVIVNNLLHYGTNSNTRNRYSLSIIDRNNISWGRNSIYMNELIKYLDLNDDYLFQEGNFYILNNKIFNVLFSDLLLFNILNNDNSFDYSWVSNYYNLDFDYETVYNIYKQNNLYGNNIETKKGWNGLADCMIEHTFERIIILLSNKYNLPYYICDMYNIYHGLNNYIGFNNLTIIACNSKNQLKINTLINNLYYLNKISNKIIIINSINIEQKIIDSFKDNLLFINNQFIITDNFLQKYKDNNKDLINMDNQNLINHIINYGINENRIETIYNIEFYYTNDITYHDKHLYYLNKNNIVDKYKNIILTNDKIIITDYLDNLNDYFNDDIELTMILNKIDFVRFNNNGIKKFIINNSYNIFNNSNNLFLDLPTDFDPKIYIELNDDLYNLTDNEAIEHFIKKGIKYRSYKKINIDKPIDNKFNYRDYIELNTDLSHLSEEEAIEHYKVYGYYENRLCKKNLPKDFNYEDYIFLNLDLSKLNRDEAINHYLFYGCYENRLYKKIDLPDDFDYNVYLYLNPDIYVETEIEAKQHYIKYGYYENRPYRHVLSINSRILSDFLDIYEVSSLYNTKIEFRFECFKNINYIKNITLPEIKIDCNNEAILIELNRYPHIEFQIRNAILELGSNYSYTVICGLHNYNFILKMCNQISPNIKIIKTEYYNISDYNLIISSNIFDQFVNKNKLIYYEDSNIFNNKIIQFKPFYSDKIEFLQQRGGWKSIIKNFIDCNLYSDNSELYFFDTIEQHFLFKTDYICNNKWFGIFHCTPFTPEYLKHLDLNEIFNNNNFIKSLENCVFIISLSNYLTEYLKTKINNIPIHTLKHPVVSDNIINFNINNYFNNKNKKIIQIGQQLRRLTSIYLLDDTNGHEKLWLTGNQDYKLSDYLLNREIQFLNIDINKDIELYYTKTYEEYDKLLSENIVFIDLIDSSANNTILECIIRKTPIIVNKIGGVVDYLGDNYPLYFTNLNDISKLLTVSKIKEAHEYLLNIKDDLSIEYFTKQIYNIIYKSFSIV